MGTGRSYKSMFKLGTPCSKCGSPMFITTLTGRLFCRECWEYREDLEDE